MPEAGEERALDVRLVRRVRGVPSGLEVVLQEEARGLADLVLGPLALGQDERQVVVELRSLTQLLQFLKHL